MPKGKTRLTAFARFFIFMLLAAPLSLFIASYYNGEDSIQNVETFLQKGKEKFSNILSFKESSNTPITMSTSFLGLRTTIYKVPDLAAAKKWYSQAFQTEPYFDEPFYVGFNIAGFELGLQPTKENAASASENVLSYWGVNDIQAEFDRLLELGATTHETPQNVGGSIEVATVKDPWGNIVGLIYNPEFRYKE